MGDYKSFDIAISSAQPKMTCPKCGFEQPQAQMCMRCGIVVSRYHEQRATHTEQQKEQDDAPLSREPGQSALKKPRRPSQKKPPPDTSESWISGLPVTTRLLIGIIGLLSLALGFYTPSGFMIPAAATLAFLLLMKILPRQTMYSFRFPLAVFLGHWSLLLLLASAATKIHLLFAIQLAVMPLVGLWLFFWPSIIPFILLGIYQILMLGLDILGLGQLEFGTPLHKAGTAHVFLRIVVMLGLFLGFRGQRDSQTTQEQESDESSSPQTTYTNQTEAPSNETGSPRPMYTKQSPVTPSKPTLADAPVSPKPLSSNMRDLLQKRIKLIANIDASPKYDLISVAPIKTSKVVPVTDGISLGRLNEPPVLFQQISAICVFSVTTTTFQQKKTSSRRGKTRIRKSYEEKKDLPAADVFLSGKPRPYRILAGQVEYSQFLEEVSGDKHEDLRQFLLTLITSAPSLYTDRETLEFLTTGKMREPSESKEIERYEKQFWGQLMGSVRFQCDNCQEVYWVDGRKIPEAGARTQCARCKQPVFIQVT